MLESDVTFQTRRLFLEALIVDRRTVRISLSHTVEERTIKEKRSVKESHLPGPPAVKVVETDY
jgi:hypothetical protein